jgi:hypothetical protein
MLPGVAATVRELLTAKVKVTAAALLVVWAFELATDKMLRASAAMKKANFLMVFKL